MNEENILQDPDSGIMIVKNRQKRPGRPPTGTQPPTIAKIGNLLQKPTRNEYFIEVLFARSLVKVISQVISMFVKQQLRHVLFRFEENGIYIWHKIKNDSRQSYPTIINVFFDAKFLHYYYCEKATKICLPIDQLQDMLGSNNTSSNYIHLIVPKTPQESDNKLWNGLVKLRVHSLSDSLAAYCEKVIRSLVNYDIEVDAMLSTSHYLLEFWVSNRQFKGSVNKQKGGYMDIEKVTDGNATINISSGRSGSSIKITIPENSQNVTISNLYPTQVIYSSASIGAVSDFIQAIDPPSEKLYIKAHPTEPPILSYRIELLEESKTDIACYIDFRLPPFQHTVK